MNILFLISKIIKKLHFAAIRESKIHKTAKVCSGSYLVRTNLGKYSYVGNFCTIINTSIGNFCSIADNCIIGGANHPINWVSTSPVFHSGKNILGKNFSNHNFKTTEETSIGNDVWIGNNCLIKNNIKISNGAVIGMGSIVTKNVGAYEIWAGNPAKLIRKRFAEDTISQLLKTEWWAWSDNEIKKSSLLFNEVRKFLSEQKL